MKIKHFLLLAAAFLGTAQINFAQTQSPCEALELAKKTAKETNSTAPYDDLLQTAVLKRPDQQAVAYTLRAKQRKKINRQELSKLKGSVGFRENATVTDILMDYQKAIEVCPDCELMVQRERYTFLKDMRMTDSPLAVQDFARLKAAGYKKQRSGISVHAQVVQGHDTWLGGGVALVGYSQPAYRMHYTKPSTGEQQVDKHPPVGITAMEFNYVRSMQHGLHDFSANLIRLNAPLVLALTQFGVQTGETSEGNSIGKRWYYQPEIGVGYNGFSLSYGYRMMFKKGDFDGRERHLAKLRYTLFF